MFGMRTSCSECGAPIDWLKPGEFDGELDSELLADVKRAEAFMGEPVTSVWRCARSACGEVGFFGSVHSGF
jgi:hypothetical protein